MWTHCTRRGLTHALIEVRQDLIRDEAGQRAWADRLVRILRKLMADPDLMAAWRTVGAARS
jgi:predicted N-formylglutamate amidohydrolase